MRGDGAKKPFRFGKRFFLSKLFLSKKRKSMGPAQRPRPLGWEIIQVATWTAGPYKPDPDLEEDQRRAIRESPLRANNWPRNRSGDGRGEPRPYKSNRTILVILNQFSNW